MLCEEIGANLVEIDTVDEMDFLRGILEDQDFNNNRFWVGLKKDTDGVYRWPVSGAAVSDDSVLWGSGEPGGGDVCVRLHKRQDTAYKLRGVPSCDHKKLYYGICEKPSTEGEISLLSLLDG